MLQRILLGVTLRMGRQVAIAHEDDREPEDAGILEVDTDDAMTYMLRLGAALEMAGELDFAEVGSFVSRRMHTSTLNVPAQLLFACPDICQPIMAMQRPLTPCT